MSHLHNRVEKLEQRAAEMPDPRKMVSLTLPIPDGKPPLVVMVPPSVIDALEKVYAHHGRGPGLPAAA